MSGPGDLAALADAATLRLRGLLGLPPPRPRRHPRREAVRMLAGLLAGGPVPVREVRAAAEEAGIGWRTVERAKAALGVRSVRLDGGIAWALPAPPP